VVRVDAAWFAVEPIDMRAGVDTALARVVSVFGQLVAGSLRAGQRAAAVMTLIWRYRDPRWRNGWAPVVAIYSCRSRH
jgi:hypothetical protein